MKKSIAIIQPVYLPWLGYFEQMALCDEFMFLDDVQYTERDWRNRNRIRNKDGWMWLTVPIQRAKLDQLLLEKKINSQATWRRKHLTTLRTNYKPCPYFEEVYALVEKVFDTEPEFLVDLTIPLIKSIARYLGLSPEFSLASDIPKKTGGKQGRVIELMQARHADLIYTGPAAQDYTGHDFFAEHGLEIVFQDYHHPKYKQHFKGFESHMSVIDLLMNHGSEAREILLSSPKPGFAT